MSTEMIYRAALVYGQYADLNEDWDTIISRMTTELLEN